MDAFEPSLWLISLGSVGLWAGKLGTVSTEVSSRDELADRGPRFFVGGSFSVSEEQGTMAAGWFSFVKAAALLVLRGLVTSMDRAAITTGATLAAGETTGTD